MVGSLLGGLAPTMPVLVAARVVQGLGAGGMLVLIQAAVADVWPVRDRAPVMSMIGAVFAVAALGGPLLGGWLAAGPGWRWMFWINLPVGAAALVACLVLLPPADPARVRQSVRPADLLPVALLRDRTLSCVVAAGFVLGLATFGLFGYLPTYLQLGRGLGPVESGLWMLTLVAGSGRRHPGIGAAGEPDRGAPAAAGDRRTAGGGRARCACSGGGRELAGHGGWLASCCWASASGCPGRCWS